MKNTSLIFAFLLASLIQVTGQENLSYQKPSDEILDLLDVPLAPSVLIDADRDYMILRYRDAFKSIEELSKKELRLAGLRIDPVANIGSRTRYYNNIKVMRLSPEEQEAKQVTGLPSDALLANFTWSPDQGKMAFTHTVPGGVELWVLDVSKAEAIKLSGPGVNANMGDALNWFEDGEALLVKMVPGDRKELIEDSRTVPTGPTISVADGRKAQNRTYQDLLKDANDEFNFEQLTRSTLVKVGMDGSRQDWLPAAMYDEVTFSPDGSFVLVSNISRPFSYLVPYYRFPSTFSIYTKQAKLVTTIAEVPLLEDLPKGFMSARKGPRSFSWRSDLASTLIYVQALDEGDPAIEAEFRDEVFQLEAPFHGQPVSLLKTVHRISGIRWGNEDLAVASDYWFNTRNTKTYVFYPSKPATEPQILFDRDAQDRYGDPGRFVMKRNEYGSSVLSLKGNTAYLIGAGHTEEGQFPFLDQIDLQKGNTKRLYQSNYTDRLERIFTYDASDKEMIVRIESATDYPNYYVRQLKKDPEQITSFENPFRSIQDVHKEVITYEREDGLELSGTLYLPLGYDREAKEKKPMIMWAYPVEYKDKKSAGQQTSNPNAFTYPSYRSPVFWVTKGYVVLDDAAFPIVGEGDNEPNDSFRKQLVDNAEAAIDAVDAMGYIDRERVAIGGHSYGAFMVANLLSHSNLFAAGIARSGAYNRTLTPFGFQREERNYWEAPEVYYTMSPFMHADKMKTPLLLIHGEEDNNSGTYPMQSIRYFNALKGLGATVRLVMLPKESHGYVAKESVLHVVWEQDQWLEKYLK